MLVDIYHIHVCFWKMNLQSHCSKHYADLDHVLNVSLKAWHISVAGLIHCSVD